MSVCDRIRQGQDATCLALSKKYYQQAVIVNRSDVFNKAISTSYLDIDGIYHCRHRVAFDLFEGASGFRFSLGENASAIFGTAEKNISDGIPQYSHTVNIAVLGVSEASKCILNQLDNSDYFAALQFYDGTVEIFGFEYGLGTGNYTYDPQATGGAMLKLSSLQDSPEDELPFVYYSLNPGLDFDNAFGQNVFDISGDFNDDFNNDFNNQ